MSRPIRIVRVIARMNVGGPAWQVSVLTRRLVPPEFQSTLVIGEVGEGEADFIRLRAPELPHVVIEGLGRAVRPWSDLAAFVRLVRILREERPDIVHTHTAKAGVVGRLAAITARVPHRVHTFHGHLLNGYFSPAKTKVVVALERLLATRTSVIAAVGEKVRDDLLAVGIGRLEQYRVVPPGVAAPSSIDRAEARAALGLADHEVAVTFIGRLTAIKRPDRLLASFRCLASTAPNAVLLVVGDGELSEVSRRDAAPLGDRVRFLGWRSDLDRILCASDVAVLTSDNEGMPVTLIEASMAGVPCVTTDVGSAREVVDHGVSGFVTSSEPSAIAQSLNSLVTDVDLRVRMGREAARRARRLFGEERLAADYAEIYRSVVGQTSMDQ